MNARRFLIVAIVTALLGGLLVGIVGGGVTPSSLAAKAAASSPIQVPVGHVGDHITYALFNRSTEDQHTTPVAGQPWEARGAQAFFLANVSKTLDSRGAMRDVLVVATNRTHSFVLGVHIGGSDESGVLRGVDLDYVDLETRAAVRTDVRRQDGDFVLGFFNDVDPQLSSLLLQGATLRAGDDLTGFENGRLGRPLYMAVYSSVQNPWLFFSEDFSLIRTYVIPWTVFEDEQANITGRVEGPATVDGVPALAAVVEASTRYELAEEDADPERSRTGTFRMTTRTWFGAEHPYPLAEQTTWIAEPDEGAPLAEELLFNLVQYEAGQGGPVPWTRPPGAHGAPSEPAGPSERTSQRGTLDEGTGSRLPYPLSRAVQDAMLSTYAEFQLWRAQHPDHRLVGAYLDRDYSSRPEAPAHRWELTFGDGTGSFGLIVSRPDGAPAGVTDPQSPGPGPGVMPPSEFAPSLLTVAAAERMWDSVASRQYTSRASDRFTWGGSIIGGNPPVRLACAAETPHGPVPWPWEEPEYAFSYAAVGYGNGGSCVDTSGEMESSVLVVDLYEGRPLALFEVRRDLDLLVPAVSAPEPGSPMQAATVGPGLPVPELVNAAWVSGGLFAALLAAYFWPIVKFATTRALLVVPGYSKLRRDRLLDQRVRDDLLQAIQESPGIHASELARRVDAGWGTVVHHLAILERNELVSSLVEGRHRRYFPMGAVDWSRRGQIALLQHAGTRRVYDLVLAEPGLATATIAGRLGVTTAGAMWHLGRLEKAGLLVRVRKGRAVTFRAAAVEVGAKTVVAV